MAEGLYETHIPGRKPDYRGKVRDLYELGGHLIIAATDRLSAFDWVNPAPIPDKGRILTALSLWWFEQISDIVPNHLVSADLADFPPEFQEHREQFEGRSMLVKKCSMLPIEVVIRGYLAGSGWKEYQQSGTVCGIQLPPGLTESAKLPRPIFTPATKATDGHDINIPPAEAEAIAGEEVTREAAAKAHLIYKRGHEICSERGIILCDTKFEFGVHDGGIILCDEALTPDSSRFWPADQYEPGHGQPSFDKQFVRDFLESTGWDKNSPQPPLPEDIIAKTREKYWEAYEKLTKHARF